MAMCCHCCQFSTLLGSLDGEEGRWRGLLLLLHTRVFWFPPLSFFLQTAPHVTTLLQIYSDLCAHQNLQKRPIQLKFKMSQHHSEKTSVDQTDGRKQRKNFAWWWIWDAFIIWVFYPILCLFVAITSRRFSSVFFCYSNRNPKVVKLFDTYLL